MYFLTGLAPKVAILSKSIHHGMVVKAIVKSKNTREMLNVCAAL